mmetsp:Transcript_1735/g.2827  ORF Transcript_1735/g.2827 Transcript_1735/m.2827 type:complete len:114 (-) Transcript_1735:240-581(-)
MAILIGNNNKIRHNTSCHHVKKQNTMMKTNWFAGFLKKCACIQPTSNKLSFVLPSNVIVKAYMEHLRSTQSILDNTDDVIVNNSTDQDVSSAICCAFIRAEQFAKSYTNTIGR